MSTTERRIVFSGEDAGVERTLDNLRQKAEQVSREIAEGSEETARSSREALDNINEQISAIERRNQAEQRQPQRGSIQRMRAESQETIRGMIRETADMGGGEQADYIERQIRSIQQRSRRETQRRLYAAERRRDVRMEGASTYGERARIEEEFESSVSEIKRGGREDQIQVELLREILDAIRETSEEEIREDRENVMRQVDEMEDVLESGRVPEGREEEFLRRSIQREELAPEDDRTFQSIVGGLLLGRAMQTASTLPGARTEEDVISKLIEIIPVSAAALLSTKVAGTGIDVAAIGATAGGIASSAYKRSVDEALRAERASNLLSAMTGATPFQRRAAQASMRGNVGGFDVGRGMNDPSGIHWDEEGPYRLSPTQGKIRVTQDQLNDPMFMAAVGGNRGRTAADITNPPTPTFFGQEFGFDIATAMEQARGLGRARGTGAGLLGITRESLALQRAFGLDPNQIGGVAGRRLMGAGAGDPMSDVGNLIAIMRSQGGFANEDFTRLAGILEAQNALLEEQSGYLENLDPNVAASVFARFAGTGGSFDITQDRRATGRILQLNQALRQPGNQFQQAMNFAVLARQNPEMSYFEMLQAQEQGIMNPELLTGTLGMLRSQFGGGENFRLGIMNRFGIGANQSAELARIFESGQLNTLGQRQIENILKGEGGRQIDIEDRAREFTAQLEISQAKITDAFTQGATDGIAKVTELTAQKIEEVADAIITKIMKSQISGSSGITTPLQNNIPGGSN